MLPDNPWREDSHARFRRQAGYRDRNPLGGGSGTTKRRTIYAPNDAMRAIHQGLVVYLRKLREHHISEQIAPTYRSPFKNIVPHRKQRFFFLLDIHDAYGSVDLDRMVGVLCSFDGSLTRNKQELKRYLQRYCLSKEGGLATGAPASVDLFDLYAGRLVDEPLWEFLRTHVAQCCGEIPRYTRYLDDLTISSNRPLGASLRYRIKRIIRDAGFTLSRKKVSPPLDLRKGPVTITGLRLEWGGRIFTPRYYLKEFRARLRRAIATRQFQGDYSIEQMAGMYGVFWSGVDRQKPFTILEQRLIDLWKTYRDLWQQSRPQDRQLKLWPHIESNAPLVAGVLLSGRTAKIIGLGQRQD